MSDKTKLQDLFIENNYHTNIPIYWFDEEDNLVHIDINGMLDYLIEYEKLNLNDFPSLKSIYLYRAQYLNTLMINLDLDGLKIEINKVEGDDALSFVRNLFRIGSSNLYPPNSESQLFSVDKISLMLNDFTDLTHPNEYRYKLTERAHLSIKEKQKVFLNISEKRELGKQRLVKLAERFSLSLDFTDNFLENLSDELPQSLRNDRLPPILHFKFSYPYIKIRETHYTDIHYEPSGKLDNELINLELLTHQFIKDTDIGILDLSGAKINEIPQKFVESDTLSQINLSKCQISTIHPDAFSKLPNLNDIDLSHNEISELPDEIFSNNHLLSNINLSHNPLTKLPSSLLETSICDNDYSNPIDLSNTQLHDFWTEKSEKVGDTQKINSLIPADLVDHSSNLGINICMKLNLDIWMKQPKIIEILTKLSKHHLEQLKSKVKINLEDPSAISDPKQFQRECWDHILLLRPKLYDYLMEFIITEEEKKLPKFQYLPNYLHFALVDLFQPFIDEIVSDYQSYLEKIKLYLSVKKRKDREEMLFGEIDDTTDLEWEEVKEIKPFMESIDDIIKKVTHWQSKMIKDDYISQRRCCRLHGRLGDTYCNICGLLIPEEWRVIKEQ